MPIWSFVLTTFIACALGSNLFASEKQSASEPSDLNIDRLEFLGGVQCTLEASGKLKSFIINIVLSNPTDSPIDIWEPTRNEGSSCPELVFTSPTGQQITLVPSEFPQTGPPFSRTIPAHSTLSISRDLADLTQDHSLAPGKYSVKAIYHNQISEIGPVGNVWTGSIASKEYKIEIVGPK
jgi:hypothetical protein